LTKNHYQESEKLDKLENSPELVVKDTSDLIPLILLGIAVIALSITAILVRICFREMSAETILFNRLWMAALVFGFWNGLGNFRTQKSPQPSVSTSSYQIIDIFLLVGVALIHLCGRLLWILALSQTSVANANVLGSLTPLFATLGAWLFFKQGFDSRFLLGLGLAIIGATTLEFEDFFTSTNNFIGDSLALVSSLFYGIKFLITEKLRIKFSTKTILIWRSFLGTILMLPVVLIFGEQIFPISWIGWLSIISLAVICEAVGHGLVVYSLKHFSSSFVSLVLLLDPIVAAILAWILFSENLSILNLFGFAIIIQGIYLAKTGKGAEKQIIEGENSPPKIVETQS